MASTGTTQSTTITVTAPARPFSRFVVSFDKQSATTGTVDITIKARGMSDAHTPASNQFDTTGTDRQFELTGGDVGSVILTPDSLDSAVAYRVEFFD